MRNQYKLYIGMERPHLIHPSQKLIFDFLSRSRHLTKLTIQDHEDVEFLVSIALKTCPNLKNLEIIASPEIMKKMKDSSIVSMYKWSDKILV